MNDPSPGQLFDPPLRRAFAGVALAGLALALVGFGVFGTHAGVSVFVGASAALLNLWVFALVARALLGNGGKGWGVLAMLKMLGLFGGVWWLFRTDVVSALPFAAGYAAMPLGITLSQLFAPAPPEDSLWPGLPVFSGPPAGRSKALVMPEHTSFISYLLALFPALGENAHNVFGQMFPSHEPVGEHQLEPLVTSLLVMLAVLGMAAATRAQLLAVDQAVIPETRLSLRTFVELFVGYFYDLAKGIMGPKRAKQYFPVIGTCALFIFFSNVLGLVPGMTPPTSSWNITFGCALLVFLLFNYYGIRENGIGYFKHLAGPWLGPWGIPLNIFIFAVEAFSVVLRLVTLSVRLMINMSADHLIVSIFLGLVAVILPLPVMLLGVIVIVVQTLVFSLLTAVYIGLATEHEEHH